MANEPGVVRWWEGQDVSWEGVVRQYGGVARDWREQWIALLGDEPVGWLQCYLAVDNPEETEHWWDFGIDQQAAEGWTSGGIEALLGRLVDVGR